MKIKSISLHHFKIPLSSGKDREGSYIQLTDENRNRSWGEISPLPNFSKETLAQAIKQLKSKKESIYAIEWSKNSWMPQLKKLDLYPSVLFGLESALLSLIDPTPSFNLPVSALLMGTFNEIQKKAQFMEKEGFISAKLKVNSLSFKEAFLLIHRLKKKFRLRIDVNRAWNAKDSLYFFSQFPPDSFDYIEEPFQNPHDLYLFTHPLAIDESYPYPLNIKELENLSTLKSIVYKPTIQGGLLNAIPLYNWTKKQGKSFVLSSSFESVIGLEKVAAIAYRLSIKEPVGLGTYHYLY